MSIMERINRRLPVLQSAYQDECEVEWHDMNEALALVYVAKEEIESLRTELAERKQGNESLLRELKRAQQQRGQAERERDKAHREIETLLEQLGMAIRERDEARKAYQAIRAALAPRLQRAEQDNAALLKGIEDIKGYATDGVNEDRDSFEMLAKIYYETESLLAQYETAQPTAQKCKCNITGPILCPECDTAQGENMKRE